MNFDSQVVMVTGGSGLIGATLCRAFANAGATVLSASRRARRSTSIPKNAGKARIIPLELDLADPKSIDECFRQLRRRGPMPRVLIANASSREALAAPFEQVSHREFARLCDVDLAGHFLCARQIVQALPRGATASMVFISSIYGWLGPDLSMYPAGMSGTPPQYAAAKAGVLGLTRYLAARWGERGIRVNAIVAGGVSAQQPKKFIANYARKTMLGRMARPEEISSAAMFLASEDASYITGAFLAVDGGFSAW